MLAKQYTPQELCNAIFVTVSNAQKPMTRREICQAIGRKKSPHIVAMIKHLKDTGWFEETLGTDKSGRSTLFYKLGHKSNHSKAC